MPSVRLVTLNGDNRKRQLEPCSGIEGMDSVDENVGCVVAEKMMMD